MARRRGVGEVSRGKEGASESLSGSRTLRRGVREMLLEMIGLNVVCDPKAGFGTDFGVVMGRPRAGMVGSSSLSETTVMASLGSSKLNVRHFLSVWLTVITYVSRMDGFD